MTILKTIWHRLLDYFFYRKCYFCGNATEESLMCPQCREIIKKSAVKRTKIVDGVRVCGFFAYDGHIKKLIRAIKYHDKRELAVEIAKILSELTEFGDDAEIIPVPLYFKRKKKRKFNQSELIASFMGYKVNTNLVKRVKDTAVQYKLSPKERKSNLDGAFCVEPGGYSGQSIILFDDILTTGATMSELARELKKNNINNIEALVVSFAGKY